MHSPSSDFITQKFLNPSSNLCYFRRSLIGLYGLPWQLTYLLENKDTKHSFLVFNKANYWSMAFTYQKFKWIKAQHLAHIWCSLSWTNLLYCDNKFALTLWLTQSSIKVQSISERISILYEMLFKTVPSQQNTFAQLNKWLILGEFSYLSLCDMGARSRPLLSILKVNIGQFKNRKYLIPIFT